MDLPRSSCCKAVRKLFCDPTVWQFVRRASPVKESITIETAVLQGSAVLSAQVLEEKATSLRTWCLKDGAKAQVLLQ